MLDRLKEMFESLAMEFSPKCFKRLGIFSKKPRLSIWIIFSFVIVLGGNIRSLSAVILSIILYAILIMLALSDIPERIYRLFEDVRRVATQTEKDRLIPLFNEVYEKAREQSGVSAKIRLYIIDQMLVNAFAVGGHTIVVTRGLISTMSDKEIKGILAHEFGHIAKGDSQVTMLITVVTNSYILIALLIAKLLSFIERLTGENSFVGSIVGFFRSLIELAVKYLMWLMTFLVSSSGRRMEYKADKYAAEIGYREQLISALYKLYDMQVSDKKNLVERIKAGHPKLAYRIERLENR